MRKLLFALLLLPVLSFAQGTATNIRNGSNLPTACVNGDIFHKTSGSIGVYECTSPGNPGTWTHIPYSVSNITALFSGCSGTAYLGFDGACHTAVGSPAGSDTYVQFNDGGSFGGEANLVWDKTNHKLGLGSGSTAGYIEIKPTAGGAGNATSGLWRIGGNSTSGAVECKDSSGTSCLSSGSGTVTSSGSPSSGNIPKFTSSTNIAPAAASDVVTLFNSGTCSGYLKSDGTCDTPAGSSGALVLLEQHTASSSSSLNFTTAISSTYDTYLIEFVNIIPASGGTILEMRMSTNGGSTYDSGNNYSWGNYRYTDSGSSPANSGGLVSNINITNSTDTISTTANWSVNGFMKLYAPGSSIYKMVIGEVTYFTGTTVAIAENFRGDYLNTTAVNAFQFFISSGNIASGTIRVYGVAK